MRLRASSVTSPKRRLACIAVPMALLGLIGCDAGSPERGSSVAARSTTTLGSVATTEPTPTGLDSETTSTAHTTSAPVTSTTAPPPTTTPSMTTVASSSTSSVAPTTSTATPTTETPTTATPTTVLARPRQAPVVDDVISYAHDEHHDYPAADIFASSDCGAAVVAASDGVIDGFEGATTYDRDVDDPAKRGGNWVSILGTDGVRYYVAHLATVSPTVAVGVQVAAGDDLGTLGTTGRSSACHTHFGLSPGSCPVDAWWVRRGVVWPADYLDAWRAGEDRSPADEVTRWLLDQPGACDDPAATGFPVG